MKKLKRNQKAAIMATVLSGWMLATNSAFAANLMAGIPSDYVNSQLGAITGSYVTTHVDAEAIKGVVTDLNRDPAVFNVMVNGESKIFLRQYTYSTTELKGSVLFDSDGNWASIDNPSGTISTAPNAHGVAASGDYLYIADYDLGYVGVAKITDTGLVEDSYKSVDLKQQLVQYCGAVFKDEYARVHGESVIVKDGYLYVMVNVNPHGDVVTYDDSYLIQYKIDIDGSLKYINHTRAGKNTDVVRMNLYNNMILTSAIGGYQNYGDSKHGNTVPGEGGSTGNADTCITIGVVNGGKLSSESIKVVVPEKVQERGLDFRDLQILPNGTAYIMTYNLSGSGGGSTMRVYKTTVTNLLSDNPADWEEVIYKTVAGSESDESGSGWFNKIFAEYYTKRVWAEIGDSLVVYTDGDSEPKYTWLTKEFSTNEQLYKWNALITISPDNVTGNKAMLVTHTPEGLTSSSATVVTTVNENATNKSSDYNYSITGTIADDAYSAVTKDNSIYTFESDKVINLSLVREGDLKNNILAAVYANDGNDITVNAGDVTLQLQAKNYISTPVGVFVGNGKTATINAGKLNIITQGYDSGNTLTNAIWLDPTKAGEGAININSDVNICMVGGYGGNGIAVQKTDRWGEASYSADKEAAITINGDVSIKGMDSESWGIGLNEENVFSRFNNAGILTSVEKSSVTVNGDVDFDVYGNGVTTNAKDSVVGINGGGKITVPSGMNYGYYTLASFLGTINMNTGTNGNVPGSDDVQLNGDIFALNTGTINLALTTEASYLNGIVDNGGTVNLWLQNGASWINEASNIRYHQDNEDVGSGEQSRVTNFVGGNSKASAGVIHQTTNSKDLTIDNYSGYTKVLYGHDASNPTNIYGGNVTIGSASNGSNITLITNYDANMSSTDVQNEVLNVLANKLYYIGYTNGENNLTGTVAIAEGLTASSVYQYVGDIAYSSSTGQGRLDGTGKPAPVEPDRPTLEDDDVEVDKSAETWESNISGENVQVEIKEESTWKGDSKGDNLTANITNSTWEGDSEGAEAEVKLQDGGKWHGEHKGQNGKVDIGKDSEWIGNNYGEDAKVHISEGAWSGENAGQKAEVTLSNGGNWTGANSGDDATINVDGATWTGANTGDKAQIYMSGNASWDNDNKGSNAIVVLESGTWNGNNDGEGATVNISGSSSWVGNSEGKGAKITLGSKKRMRTFSLRSTGPVWEGDNTGDAMELEIGSGASWIGNNFASNAVVNGDIEGLWKGYNAGTITVDGITWNGDNLANATVTIGSGVWDGSNSGNATFNGGTWNGENTETGKVTVNADGWTGNNAGEAIVTGGTWGGDNSGTVTMNSGVWNGTNSSDATINGGEWSGTNKGTATIKGGLWSGDNTGEATLENGEWCGDNLTAGTAIIEGGKWTGDNTGTAIIKDGTWTNDNSGIVTFNGGKWTGDNDVNGKVTVTADGWTGNNAGTATLNDGTWNGTNAGTVTLNKGTWTGGNAGNATITGGEWTGANSGTVTFNGGNWTGDNDANGKVTVTKDGWTGDNTGAGTVIVKGTSWDGNNLGQGANLTFNEKASWDGGNSGANATVKLDGASNWSGTNTGVNLNLTLDGASVWTGYSNVDGFTLNLNGNSVWKNTGASKVANFASNNGVVDMSAADGGNITIDSYSGNVTVLYDHSALDAAGTQVTVNGGNFTVTSAEANSAITLVMGREGLVLAEEDSINAALNALAAKLFYSNYAEKNLSGTVKIAEGLTASSVSKQTASIVFSGKEGQGSVDKSSIDPGPQYPTEQDKSTFTTAITGDAYDSDAQKEYRKFGVIQKDAANTYNFTKVETAIITVGSTIDTVENIVLNLNGNNLNLASGNEAPTIMANNNITINGVGVLEANNGIKVADDKTVILTLSGKESELKADVLVGEGVVEVDLGFGTWIGDNAGNVVAYAGSWIGDNSNSVNYRGGEWTGDNAGTATLYEVTWTGDNAGTANFEYGCWYGNNHGTVILDGNEWQGDNVGTATFNKGEWTGSNIGEVTVADGTWKGNNSGTVIFNSGSWTGDNTENGTVIVNATGWNGNNTGAGSVELSADWTGNNTANGSVTLNGGTWAGKNTGESATVSGANGKWTGDNSGSVTVNGITWEGKNLADGAVTLSSGTWTGNNTGIAIIEGGTWTKDNSGTVTFNGGKWTGINTENGEVTIEADGWTGNNAGTVILNDGTWDGTNSGTVNIFNGTWGGNNTSEGNVTLDAGTWNGSNEGTATINGGLWTGDNGGEATLVNGEWSGDNFTTGIAIIDGGKWTGDNIGKVTLNKGTWDGVNKGDASVTEVDWNKDNAGTVEISKGSWTGNNTGTATLTDVEWTGNNTNKVTVNNGSWIGGNESSGEATLSGGEWTGNNSGIVKMNGGTWSGNNEVQGNATITGGEWTGVNSGTAIIEGGTWANDNSGTVNFNGGNWTGDNTENGKVTVAVDGWTGDNTGTGTVIVKGATWDGNNLGQGANLTFNEKANWTGDNSGANATVKLDGASNWSGTNTGVNLNLTLDGASVWTGYSNVDGFTLNLNGNSVWKNTGASKVANFASNNGVVDMSAADGGNITIDSYSGNITIDSYSGNVTVLYDHSALDAAGTQVTVNGGNFTVTSAEANSAITLVMGREGLDLTEEDSINAALNALAAKLFYTNYAEEGNLSGTVKIAEGLTASSVSKQTASIVFGGDYGQGSVDKSSINPGPQYPAEQDKDTFTTGITGDYETDKEYRKSGVLTSNYGVYNFTKEITNIADSDIGKDVVLNLNGNDLNISQEFRGNSNVGSGIVYGSVGLTATNSKVTIDNAKNINVDHRILADNAKLTINNSGVLKVDGSDTGYAAIRSVGKDAEIHINGTVEIDGDNDLLAIGAYDLGKTYVSNGTIVGSIGATDGGSVFVNNDNAENKVTITGAVEAKKDSKVTINFNTADSKLDGNVYGEGLVDLSFANDSTWTGYSNAEGLALALNNSTWSNTGTSKVQNLAANNGVVDMTNANSGEVTVANYSGSMVVLYNHSITDDATSNMTGGKVVTVNGGNITIGNASINAEITLRTDRNGLNLESSIYTDKNLVNAALDALANKLFYTAYTTGETNLKGYVEIAEGLTASSVSKRVENVSFDKVTGQGGYEYETAYPEEQVKDTFELENALGSAEAEEALKEAGVMKVDGKYEFTSDPTELKGNNAIVATEKDVTINAEGTLKLTAEDTAVKAVGKDVTISAKNTIVTGQIGVDADDAQVNIDGSVNIEAGKGIAVANDGKVSIDEAVINSSIAAISAVGGEVNIAKGNVNGAINATNGADVNLGSTAWTGDNIGDGGKVTMTKASKWEGDNEGSNTTLTMEYNTWNGNNTGTDADITFSDKVTWTGNNTGEDATITLNGESVWTGYSNAEGLALALDNSTWNNTGSSKVQSVTANNGVVNMTNANGGDVTIANYSGSMVVLYSHSIIDDATSAMTGGKVVTVNGGNITIGNAGANAEITLRTDRNGLNVGSDVYTDKNLVNATLDALANKLFYTAYTTGETNLKGYVEIAEGLTASSASKALGDIKFDEATGQGGLDGFATVYPEAQVKDTIELENALGSAETEEALRELGVLKADGKYEFSSDPTVLKGENVVVADGKDVTITAEGALELNAGNIAIGAANNKVDVESKDLNIKGDVIAIGGGVVDVNATGKFVLDGDIQVDGNSVVTAKFSGADSKFTGNITQYDGVVLLNSEITKNGVSLEFTNKASWEGWSTSDNFQISLDDSRWHNSGASKAQSITAKKGVIYMDGANAAMDVAEFSGDLTVVYDCDDEGNILGEAFVVQKALKADEKTNSSITLFTEQGDIEVKEANEAEIKAVFGKLANKLQYEDYSANVSVDEQGNPINNYLDGYVKIAEGITGTGATADIVFGEDNTIDNVKIGPEINYGAYETAMMKGAKSAMVSSAMMWRAESNDLMKRMGDLRMVEGEYGIWAKYYGTKQEMEAQNTKYANNYKAYQLGFDKKVGDWTVGVAASYGDGESTYASGRGENSVVSLGLYGAWNGQDGQYVDVIMKRSKLDNEYQLNGDVTIGRLEADYETWATSISAEYGKRIETNKGFYVEPSVELTLGRVDGASYNTSFSLGGERLNVQQDDYDSLIGRLGLRLGQKLDKASYYAKFAVAKEFCGDYDTKYATLNASGLTDIKETSMSFKDTWYEMQIGGTAQLSDNSYIYASYERNFGADVEQKWRIDAGLRWTF